MTANDMMTLRALLEKSSDADVLREMTGFTAERLMALEVEGLTGAAHGERSPERITLRNGYRERSWETCAGTVALKIPKLMPLLSLGAFRSPGTFRFTDEPFRRVDDKSAALHEVPTYQQRGTHAGAIGQIDARALVVAGNADAELHHRTLDDGGSRSADAHDLLHRTAEDHRAIAGLHGEPDPALAVSRVAPDVDRMNGRRIRAGIHLRLDG